MQKRYILIIGLLTVFVLNMGLVRKKENPIRDTQTDPILYKQKMEQIKDGEKGPTTYSMQFYKKEKFFTEAPFSEDEEISTKEISTKEGEDLGDWWEESEEKIEKEETDDFWW